MDIEEAQKIALNWTGSAPESEKLKFIKSLIQCLNEKESNQVLSFTTHRKRTIRRQNAAKRAKIYVPGPESVPTAFLQAPVSVPVPVSSVSVPVSSVPVPVSSVPVLVSSVSVPVSSVSVPDPAALQPTKGSNVPQDLQVKEKPWWQHFCKSQIVAIDCEFVHYRHLAKSEKVKAASVAIVDFNGEVLYRTTVKHDPGECQINRITISKNGITANILRNGQKSLDTVENEVADLLKDKLVIHIAGATDFKFLGLCIGDFENFDLHSHWQQPKINSNGILVHENIGLKRLIRKYFNDENFQSGIHSAEADARATMRIFREVYIKIKQTEVCTKYNSDFDQFADFD